MDDMINFIIPAKESSIMNLSNNLAHIEQRHSLLFQADKNREDNSHLKYIMPLVKSDGTLILD